jgi:hypothetical protein
MPFDAIMLRNRFEGLCIPGLGVMRYAAMGKALMELLPHLISGCLSPQINAALASVRYEMNNGHGYLWRVLELTVPGFDPVIPIQTPIWSDIGDIFRFAQAYLLYFRLQGKMNYSLLRSDTQRHLPLSHPVYRVFRHGDDTAITRELLLGTI